MNDIQNAGIYWLAAWGVVALWAALSLQITKRKKR